MKKALSLLLALLLVISMPLALIAEEAPAAEAQATEVQATDVPPTDPPTAPPTDVPATDVPPTDVPVTDVPVTDVPPTDVPVTDVPPTDVPATDAPTQAPQALPAPSSIRWEANGDLFINTVTPPTDKYLVTLYFNGEKVKDIPLNDVPLDTPQLLLPATELLSEAGEYRAEVVALAIEGWLDSPAAQSEVFTYAPAPTADPYADMEPIAALVARVSAGEMTAVDARTALLAIPGHELMNTLLENTAERNAFIALEDLYKQETQDTLDLVVPEVLGDTKAFGAVLNAWATPQNLKLSIATPADAKADGTLQFSLSLEAIQPDPDPAQAHDGAALEAPLFVAMILPESFTAAHTILTDASSNVIPTKAENGKLCFVLDALGEYTLNGGKAAAVAPVDEAELPVLSVRLGEEVKLQDEFVNIEAQGGVDVETPITLAPSDAMSDLVSLQAAPKKEAMAWDMENDAIAVIDKEGTLTAMQVGQTVITQTNPDGTEESVVLDVTPIEELDAHKPYNRVLPAGSVKAAMPIKAAPAYGTAHYIAVTSSQISPLKNISIALSGLTANVRQTTSETIRTNERIFVKKYSGTSIKQVDVNYSNRVYDTTFSIPPSTNGIYSLTFFVKRSNTNYLYWEDDYFFYIENGTTYFYRGSSDSSNAGALQMLTSGSVPDDIGALLNLGNKYYPDVLAQMADQAQALASSGTQMSKTLAIAGWIADNIAYDTDSLNIGSYNADPFYAFQTKKAVCSGYANMMTVMLYYVGVSCVSISGFGGDNDEIATGESNHQWNAVYVDGAWRLFDVTWDTPWELYNATRSKYGENNYSYTFPSLEYMSYTHRATGVGALVSSPAVQPTTPINLGPIEAFVQRLYANVLGRAADTAGLISWRDGLANGTYSGALACAAFFFSAEFQAKTMTNTQYVTLLYNTCLGRSPDAAGLNVWVSLLEGGATRNSILNSFIQSNEFNNICASYGITRGTIALPNTADVNYNVTRFIYRLYKLVLGRTAALSELNYWTDQMLYKGVGGRAVAYYFVFSNEFTSKNLPAADYVKILYMALMDRTGETAGVNAWVNYINLYGRYVVFDGFVNSVEFKNIMASYGVR